MFALSVRNHLSTSEIPIDYASREGESSLKWYIDGPRIFLATFRKRFEYNRRPLHDLIFVSAFAVLLASFLV